ncbi:MAG: hypothetical protein LBB55_04825 [Zoogloeaceae bacterium]|nr:hypothetical protein [Zoogloeaceae bacterium]
MLSIILPACTTTTLPEIFAEEDSPPEADTRQHHTIPAAIFQPAHPQPPAPARETETPKTPPTAIFLLPTEEKILPEATTETMRDILKKQEGKRNILFTLEAWPSGRGSREVDIGLTSQAVNRVRDKLIELGVRAYRIKTLVRGDPPGDSDGTVPNPNQRRVDLFLSLMPR